MNRVRRFASPVLCAVAVALVDASAAAEPPDTSTHREEGIDRIVVRGRAEDLVGVAETASSGRVGRDEIARIPFLRAGELLETVPGLIATQHSGTGKANQFFLRGFNLDHGTDFSTFVEGVPLNLPTHGHGHGYLDTNAVIPELVDTVAFRKGPYHADVGDFSSAGTARVDYVRRLDGPFVTAGFGANGYSRTLAAASPSVAGGDLLLAAEMQFYDGPWKLDEDLEKFNGFGKWTRGDAAAGVSVFVGGYESSWRATDQIPRRAVADGGVDRLGFIDDDLGGRTARHTASVRLWRGLEEQTRAHLWFTHYDFDLWSNFTYFLEHPERGDEFQQFDRRSVYGLDAARDFLVTTNAVDLFATVGVQARHDDIDAVGLTQTEDRTARGVLRRDRVAVTNGAVWGTVETELRPWLRGFVGLRADGHRFEVDATLPANSGSETDAIVSPKAGLAFGPWASTELYASYGRGYHSNDARGTTIAIDPADGAAAERVDPLVATQGAEVGIRTTRVPGLHSTVALWWLEVDSELLFVGDAGATESSRASRRIGVEWTNHWRPTSWLTFDLDVTLTESRYRDDDGSGRHVPGAVESTVAGGAAVDFGDGPFGALRVRHFGERALVENGAVRSDPTTLVNARAGWRWPSLALTVDVLNLLDSRDDDITYFYASRLPGEPDGGVEDVHFHPVEPRTARVYLTWWF